MSQDASRRRPPKFPRPTPVPRIEGPTVSRWEHRLAQGDVSPVRAEIAAVLASGTPLLEAYAPGPAGQTRQVVTFLYEDAAADQVLLFANRLTDESSLESSLMSRLAGTDLWHVSFLMDATWRASYCFIPATPGTQPAWISAEDHVQLRAALDAGLADPHNGLVCANRAGRPMSVVELSEAPAQPWPVTPTEPAPAQDWIRAPGGHRVLLRSCGADGAEEPAPGAPTVVLFDGEVWDAQGIVGSARAAVLAGALEPVNLVLLDSGGRERRWQELDGSAAVEDFLADELIPWLAAEHGLETQASRVCVVGQSLGGLSALLCGLGRPDAVGAVLSQSASLWQTRPAEVLAGLLERDGGEALVRSTFLVEVGDQEWVLTGPHEEFLAQLERTPARVLARRYDGGHDYACWRGSLVPGLVEIYPGTP